MYVRGKQGKQLLLLHFQQESLNHQRNCSTSTLVLLIIQWTKCVCQKGQLFSVYVYPLFHISPHCPSVGVCMHKLLLEQVMSDMIFICWCLFIDLHLCSVTTAANRNTLCSLWLMCLQCACAYSAVTLQCTVTCLAIKKSSNHYTVLVFKVIFAACLLLWPSKCH